MQDLGRGFEPSSGREINTLLLVVVRILDAILVFNVLYLDIHSEPDCYFIFLTVP
jgi:hypothetical protein